MHYVTKKLGLEVLFDPKGRKGKGAYTLSTSKKEDMVLAERILKMDNKDDVLFKYLKDKLEFKFEGLKTTKEQIKKARRNIYKLPEFQNYADFQMDRENKGLPTAIGKKGLSSFKAAWADGLKDINPMKWKEAFKGLGKAGGFLKGAGIFGAVMSVGGNVVDAKEDGWQLKDVVDITTDSAVDIGANAGAMAAGAVAGSFFLPPLGTVVEPGTAVFATWAMNYKFEKLGGDNLIDITKKGVKNVTEKIDEKFKIGEKIKSIFW